MKKITIALILIPAFLIAAVQVQSEELHPIDYSFPVIQAAVANQKVRLSEDTKARWGMLTKKTQEFSKNYEAFKKGLEKPENKRKDFAYKNAQLVGMRFITDNRVWISISGSGLSSSDGFYFIKEDGEWKLANINVYFILVKKDIDSLGKAIRNYYQDNKKLPGALTDLLKPIPYISFVPLDLFNDDKMPYVYKVIEGTKCILYSLGPNSKDDNGIVEFKQVAGVPIVPTEGDIVWSFSPNNG